MAVTQVDEYDPQADPHRLKLVPPIDEPRSTTIDDNELRLQTLAVLHGVSNLLAARLILLLAVLSGAGLAGVAIWQGHIGSIVAASLYDLLVVIPVVLLATRKG